MHSGELRDGQLDRLWFVQRDDVWLDGCAAIDSCDCHAGVVRWSVLPYGHDSDSGVQHGCVPPTPYSSTTDCTAHHGASCTGLRDGQLVGLWLVQHHDVWLDGRALLDAFRGDARRQWWPSVPCGR